MANTPKRLFDSKDMEGAILYAKRIADDTGDAYPVLVDTNGALVISGNISVAASGTLVTVDNILSGTVSLSSTVVSVTLPPALSTTAVTINNATGNPANVSLTNTLVSVANLQNVTASVSTIPIVGRTLTTASGSLTATSGALSFTPTNRAKVYAISLTTTSTTGVICIFFSGGGSTGQELWRVMLQAPSGANAGANLAVNPPSFLFASRTASAVSLSLSTAVTVFYSIAYFDEA